jgi:hypothetical protein
VHPVWDALSPQIAELAAVKTLNPALQAVLKDIVPMFAKVGGCLVDIPGAPA